MTPQQIDAMKMALEALEYALNKPMWNRPKMTVAITALEEALAQPEQEPVAWLLTDKNINSLQVDSIQRLIDRLKHAHHTDIRVRINGHDEWFEADWLKHMVRVTPPQPEQNPMSDEMLQAITDPENQPSQYGTVTLDYHFEKIKKWEDLFERMSNKVLQQLEQEPVAIERMKEWIEYLKYLKRTSDQHMKIPSEMSAGTCWELALELEQFINTTPPQRTWVGLTDEEENALIPDPDGSAEANVRRVEVLPGAWGKEYEEVDAWSKPLVLQMLHNHKAKLKEKNT